MKGVVKESLKDGLKEGLKEGDRDDVKVGMKEDMKDGMPDRTLHGENDAAKASPVAPESDFTPWPASLASLYRAAGYWRGETLSQMLAQSSRTHAERLALVCGQRRWTYAELAQRVERVARSLAARGIGHGNRVILQLPNVAEFFVALFALFRLGAWPVLAQPAHRESEIGHLCQHSGACGWIVAEREQGFDYRLLASKVLATCPSLQLVIVCGEPGPFLAFEALYQPLPGEDSRCSKNGSNRISNIGSSHIDNYGRSGSSSIGNTSEEPKDETGLTSREPAAGEVALLQLSGGSTALPKLIPRTHDDYLYSVRASADICGLDAHSVYLCVLPVAHNFALSSPGTLGVLATGGCVVLAHHAAPELAFALIASEHVTLTALVPSLLQIWLAAASTPQQRQRLQSLTCIQVGGAPLAPTLAAQVQPRLGCRLQQVFGMAEGLVNYTRSSDAESLQRCTQGRPISPHDEIRVVDDADQDLPDGCTGHLLTRGPYTIRGYFRAASHNARAFTADGFYRTGDLVRRLPSGHIQVLGRAKDQINRGGEKIAAEEIEHHLQAHPEVMSAALVAMPDAFLGERSCAFIVRRNPALQARELQAFLRQRGLASYKLPDRIEFASALPLTAVGKIDKRSLRQRLGERTG